MSDGPAVPADPVTLDLPVEGMHCAACARTVERLLEAHPQVAGAQASFGTHRARVRGDATVEQLDRALAQGGYGVGRRATRLTGLSAAAEAAVARIPGVFDTALVEGGVEGGFEVVHADLPGVLDQLRALVAAQGEATLDTEHDAATRRLARDAAAWRARFLLALGPTLYLFAVSMFGLGALLPAFLSDGRVLFLLALPVQFGAGWPILAGAARTLRRGSTDMDVLVALGTLSAFVYSTVRAFQAPTGPTFFDTSATILTLVCLGRWLEARSRRSTGDALRALARLEPETAWLVRGAADEQVPVHALLPQDRIRIRPGEPVPADGTVVEGSSGIDESLLTGESMPVTKGPGDTVHAGTRNGGGLLLVAVTHVGEGTVLRRIVQWVTEAQTARAPIARMADRVAGIFVPVVLAVAVLTLVGWAVLAPSGLEGGGPATMAVLLIACPCALGLATPTAIVVGTGRAARRGILFKGGDVIERAARVDTVLLDKTGTLTAGAPHVAAVHPLDTPEDRLLRVACTLAEGSEHVLSQAIAAHARAAGVAPARLASFAAVPGHGVRGQVAGLPAVLGSPAFLAAEGLRVPPDTLAAIDAAGATPVAVASGGRVLGVLALRDAPRPETAAAIEALLQDGLALGILSGDRPAAVVGLIDALGTPLPARAAQTPEAKQAALRALLGHAVVAMVGDGVNDAPALAEADVGIAVTGATDVASATAGIALVRPDLRLIGESLALARATLTIIRQNLFWAFVYNVIGIPIAAFGGFHPMVAAAAMAFSSVCVLGNSLRLRTRALRPLPVSRRRLTIPGWGPPDLAVPATSGENAGAP